MKKTTILAISAAVICVASQVNATPIYGQIDFTGYNATLDTGSAGTATEVLSWGSVTTGGGTQTLSGADAFSTTISSPWTFNSGTVNPFLSFDGFTYTLTSSGVAVQVLAGPFGFVNVSGTGILSGNGYTASAFNFSFSASSPGPSVAGEQAFSLNLTAVPDGGTTVALLGGALTTLGLIRRKLVA